MRLACDLSPRTLRDIAAPEAVQVAAAGCVGRAAYARDLLRQGIVAGAPW